MLAFTSYHTSVSYAKLDGPCSYLSSEKCGMYTLLASPSI